MLTPDKVFQIYMQRSCHEDEQEALCVGLAIVKIEFTLVQQGLRAPWMLPN